VKKIEGDDDSRRRNRTRNHKRSRLSTYRNRVVDAACTVLRYPLLLAGVAIEMVMVPSVAFALIGSWGALRSLMLFLTCDSPLLYVFGCEIWRQLHSLPESEAFETSPERWNQALTEYINDVKDDE